MISSSRSDVPTTSPTALPIRSLATGDMKEIEPDLGSASSSPTIRYFCTRSSSRLKVTVLPKATVSLDVGSSSHLADRVDGMPRTWHTAKPPIVLAAAVEPYDRRREHLL